MDKKFIQLSILVLLILIILVSVVDTEARTFRKPVSKEGQAPTFFSFVNSPNSFTEENAEQESSFGLSSSSLLTLSVWHDPTSTLYTWQNMSIRASANAGAGLNVTTIKIYLDGVNIDTCNPNTQSYTCIYRTYFTSPGNHTYFATAVDSSGNTVRDPSTGEGRFTIINIAPIWGSVFHSPTTPKTGETIQISASASDNGKVASIAIYLDNLNVQNCTINTAVGNCKYYISYATPGNHTYYPTAVDNEGSMSAYSTKTFSVSPDSIKPIVLVSAPSTVSTGQPITISANANDSAEVSKIDIFVDGTNVKSCTINAKSGTCDYQTSYPAVGTHRYYATATDNMGNIGRNPTSGEKTFDVVSDAPPTITVSAPSTVNKGQTITIASSANDNNQVSDIKVYLDGTLKKTCTINSQSGNCDYPVTFTTCGDHFYYATTSDNSGNSARDPVTGEKKFSVIGCGGSDNIPPQISLSISGDDPSEGKRVTFTATASDNVQVSKITIYPGIGAKTCTINAPSGTCTYRTVWPLVRDYYAVAVDSSGNTAKSN